MIDSDNIQYQTLACLQRAFLFPLEKFVFMLRANQGKGNKRCDWFEANEKIFLFATRHV